MTRSRLRVLAVASLTLALAVPTAGPAAAGDSTPRAESATATIPQGPTVTPVGPTTHQARADQPLSERFGQDRARANAAAAQDITFKTFRFSAGAIRRSKGNFVKGKVVTTNDSAVQGIQSELRYSGKFKGVVDLYRNGFYIPAKWGAGVARLGPSVIYWGNNQGTYTTQKSNTFRVRYGLHPKTRVKIERRGAKLTFKSRDVRYYKVSKYVRVKTAYIQVLKKGKWRKLKAIHPNRKGSSTFSIRHKGKRHYRLAVITTKKLRGGASKAVKI